jgi:hypothetical protein
MTDDLVSEFVALNSTPGPRCSLFSVELTPEDAAKLQAAYLDVRITNTAICTWLQSHGVTVRYQTVQRHRRGDCSCKRIAK